LIVTATDKAAFRFCANLKWLFTELPFIDRFDAAAKAGFGAVEYASPYEFDPAVLRQRLADNGLTQVLINTPAALPGQPGANGFACMPSEKERFREGVHRALHYASELSCPLVHVMAGLVLADASHEQASDTFLENLHWASDAAQGSGVTLVLECLNQTDARSYFLRDLDHAHQMIGQAGVSNARLLFDAYHCRMTGQDVVEQFAVHAREIAHIQFADVPGRHEPGTGDMPWEELSECIRHHDYAGWIGCEYRPRTLTRAGLGWLEDFRSGRYLKLTQH
jgi:hydroxypyruvate isomerase